MKAAFLIRCSTKKQDYERQVKDLTRLATKLGYENDTSIIFGEHITGKDDASKKDRLSIQHLKESAALGNFDVVLVSEVSRMSRDPMSGRLYVRQLINMEIPVYFRDIDTWTINPTTGEKVRDAEVVIGAAFDAAWKYIKSMKTQIASGRRDELDNNCMSIGQPFFGYKRFGGRDKENKNRWVIDDAAAEAVVATFEEYIKDGATLKSTALAITARFGDKLGKRFSLGTVEHILTFEPYCTGIKVVSLTDPDSGDVDKFEVEIPTIISRTLFDAATNKRQTNRVGKNPYPSQTTYVLSKLIKCPVCGHSLTPKKRAGEKGEKYRMVNGKVGISWVCMSGVNNSTDCKNRLSINNEKIEAIIWGLVKTELIAFANLNTEDRIAKLEEYKQKVANANADIANFEAQAAAMDKQVEKAYSAYMDAPDAVAAMAKDRYYQALAKCQSEKDECSSKIAGLKKQIEQFNYYIQTLSNPTLPNDAIAKAESDQTEMRRLVTELVEKIYPYKVTTYVSPATNRVMKFGVVLLEVHTINGLYYILYDGNQRNDKTAYYISGSLCSYQGGLSKDGAFDAGEYFVIPNASMLLDTDELIETVTFNEMVEICKKEGNTIDYTYKQ